MRSRESKLFLTSGDYSSFFFAAASFATLLQTSPFFLYSTNIFSFFLPYFLPFLPFKMCQGLLTVSWRVFLV